MRSVPSPSRRRYAPPQDEAEHVGIEDLMVRSVAQRRVSNHEVG
jgi:hypothetical protein